jgi:hypothetical protein
MEFKASTGLLDQAVSTFGEALKAGVKIQDEVGKWWTDALDQTGPAMAWQKRSQAIAQEALPAAQKNAEEWMKLVEKNYAKSINLLKKAFETEQDPAAVRDKVQDLWEASLEMVRENTQAMADANKKMMELWANLLKKNVEANGGARK